MSPSHNPMRRRNPWVAVGVRVIPPDVSSEWVRRTRKSTLRNRLAAVVTALGLAVAGVAAYHALQTPQAHVARTHVKRVR